MRSRKLGRLDFPVSELALGTWGLSGGGYGPVPEQVQKSVIDRACELGVNLFDTADSYGEGSMERLLGERLRSAPNTFIATKIGTDLKSYPKRKCFDVPFLREAFQQSQERIGRHPLDFVLLHNPSPAVMDRGEAAEYLESLVTAGELRGWGVSAGNADVVDAAIGAPCKPYIVELAYNVYSGRALEPQLLECETHQIAVFARSVLAHGLLAGLWSADKTFETGDHRILRWTRDQFRRRLSQLRAFSSLDRRRTPSSRAAALHFVLANERVASAVLGPRDVVQLDQLVREVAKEPPYFEPEELARLSQRLEELGC